jgi:hypothetical protein
MKKTIVVLVISLIGFLSCERYIPYQIGIDNKTNDTIKVYFLNNAIYTQGVDSVICFPNSKKIYFNHSGRSSKYNCYTGINKNEVITSTSSGRNLKKDMTNLNNWECEGSYETGWFMTFVITEEDLE